VILNNEEHLTEEGLKNILKIRTDMNEGDAGRIKYSETDILNWMKLGKSSETIRQADTNAIVDDDIVRSL
jgi:hypothetical protein